MEIFSISTSGFKEWTFSALGLILFFPLAFELANSIRLRKSAFAIGFNIFGVLFMGGWILATASLGYSDYQYLKNDFESGKCENLNGSVTNKRFERREKHFFTVQDREFLIDEQISQPGLNRVPAELTMGRKISIWLCGERIARLVVF